MLTDIKFSIVYADPPWQYQNGKVPQGGVEHKYSTLSLNQIKSLPVKQITAENCLLFLWVTFPMLQEGLDTIKAWGFNYKTIAFNWIKTNRKNDKPFFGIGYYTKSNSEVCLLGVKGKGKSLVDSNKVSQIIIAPLSKHSEKPAIARDKIVELCGDVPRIELFARKRVAGWYSWGNEVE